MWPPATVNPGDRGTVVLLTSVGPRMGCTTAALALALTAKNDCRTIVIDGDCRDARTFGGAYIGASIRVG